MLRAVWSPQSVLPAVVMSARRKRYEEEGEFCIPGLGDRNYRPGELAAGPGGPGALRVTLTYFLTPELVK